MLLMTLKSLDVERLSLDDAVEYVSAAKMLRAEYQARTLPVPEVLDDALRALERDIESRRRDTLELRLKQVRREQQATLSAAEKREALAAEAKLLEEQLATK